MTQWAIEFGKWLGFVGTVVVLLELAWRWMKGTL